MIDLVHAASEGLGIFSIPEAARYARMHPNTLRNWFCPTSKRQPLRPREIRSEEFKAITFVEFIEALAIRSFRVDYKVSFQKIREAITNARAKTTVRRCRYGHTASSRLPPI